MEPKDKLLFELSKAIITSETGTNALSELRAAYKDAFPPDIEHEDEPEPITHGPLTLAGSVSKGPKA